MEFEEQEEEMGLTPSYNSLGNNSSRVRMQSSCGEETAALTAHPPSTAANRKPRYRECMKNHAVGIAGHAVDGCGDFIASGPDGTLDALKCAACNCHRNFHRKETEQPSPAELCFYHHHAPQFTPYFRPQSGYLHMGGQQHQRPLALPSFSGGGSGAQSREDYQEDASNHGSALTMMRKRSRTKFTPEQKEKMLDLAERLGWRIQRQDDVVVHEFCNETGIRRHVLKVWMHNNKHSLGKKP